jgi:hypothetical protein
VQQSHSQQLLPAYRTLAGTAHTAQHIHQALEKHKKLTLLSVIPQACLKKKYPVKLCKALSQMLLLLLEAALLNSGSCTARPAWHRVAHLRVLEAEYVVYCDDGLAT